MTHVSEPAARAVGERRTPTKGDAQRARIIDALVELLDTHPIAEVSVMRMEAGPAELTDGYETITVEEHLTPVGCLRAGVWIAATAGMTHMAAA